MPASYAHYSFGTQVLSKLTDLRIKQILIAERPFFDLGLHGPDIFFYYKPFYKNRVMQTGHTLHHTPAMDFMDRARLIVRNAQRPHSSLAYILGFICHFALDSECHGYINSMMPKLFLSHSKIESEFDRTLMEMKKLNPLTTKTTDHLTCPEENAKIIAPFYRGISIAEVKDSVAYFKGISNLLMAPQKWQRFIMNTLFHISGHYGFMNGLMIGYNSEPRCETSNVELYRRYKNSTKVAINLIKDFCMHLEDDDTLSKRFEQDFE